MGYKMLTKENVYYFKTVDDRDFLALMNQVGKNTYGNLFFISVAERSEGIISSLQHLCNEQNIRLTGIVVPGLIIQGDIFYTGFSIYSYSFNFPSMLIKNVDSTLEDAVASLVRFVDENTIDGKEMTLNIYIDGGLRNVASLLDSIYLEIGDDVRYFGSGCGSEKNAAMPCVFDNEEIVKQALLAILIPLNADPVLEHSYTSKDIILTIGDVECNQIKSINWKPAFESYQSLVNREFGNDIQLDKDNLFAKSVCFPFGINRLDGENIVRIPTMVGDNDNIFCAGEIPPNSIITLMDPVEANSEETINTVREKIDLGTAEVILVYYCVGRLAYLKDAGTTEIKKLAKKFEPALLVGALSTGEIGSSKKGGYPLLQNATILCNAIG
ncbi:MAG: hypothetical protein D3924_05520 [Candidatus Electrothrix sp. AR4]|nr:hypothetical protein [Candidatus Electrothrix sp. AR4]